MRGRAQPAELPTARRGKRGMGLRRRTTRRNVLTTFRYAPSSLLFFPLLPSCFFFPPCSLRRFDSTVSRYIFLSSLYASGRVILLGRLYFALSVFHLGRLPDPSLLLPPARPKFYWIRRRRRWMKPSLVGFTLFTSVWLLCFILSVTLPVCPCVRLGAFPSEGEKRAIRDEKGRGHSFHFFQGRLLRPARYFVKRPVFDIRLGADFFPSPR